MRHAFHLRIGFAALAVAGAAAWAPCATAAEPEQHVKFSTNPAISARQHPVYDVIHRYEALLNSGDTAGIMKLYAPDSVAEWNDKPTFRSRQQKIDAYDALFKIAKFTTVFDYDAVDVYGDTAIVRTHHHKGATVLEAGKEVLDLNREIFVLHRVAGSWKIVLYAFNTNPNQGEE